jgi:hypothetical protein
VLRLLRVIDLWGRARLTGDLFSLSRRREVLRALTRHVFFVLGGDGWERAERAGERSARDDLRELSRAVSTKHAETGIVQALASEYRAFAQLRIDERVAHLASIARKVLHFPPRVHVVTRRPGGVVVHKQGEGSPGDSDWLCEFALRLASDPHGVSSWAGPNLAAGVRRLYEAPVLARAARFLVLAVDRHTEARLAVAATPHAGWEWK